MFQRDLPVLLPECISSRAPTVLTASSRAPTVLTAAGGQNRRGSGGRGLAAGNCGQTWFSFLPAGDLSFLRLRFEQQHTFPVQGVHAQLVTVE